MISRSFFGYKNQISAAYQRYRTVLSILWKLTVFYGINACLCYGILFWKFSPTSREFLALTFFGIFIWTFLEYLIHRYFLHPQVKQPWLGKILHYTHLKHHDDADDPHLFHIPLPMTLLVYFMVTVFLYLIFWRADYTLSVMAIIMICYVIFEWFHLWVHMTTSRKPIARWYRKHHFIHHYRDTNRCFGVTTPIWDYIFRTN